MEEHAGQPRRSESETEAPKIAIYTPGRSRSPAAAAREDAAPARGCEVHLHSRLEVNSSRSYFKCFLQVKRLHGLGVHAHTHTSVCMKDKANRRPYAVSLG